VVQKFFPPSYGGALRPVYLWTYPVCSLTVVLFSTLRSVVWFLIFFINFTYFYIRHICKLSLFVCYSFLVCNNLIALYICQHSHCIFFLINIVESVHPTQPKNIFADHICKLFHVVSLTHMGAPCFILCKEE
jgi:hypothetical protein